MKKISLKVFVLGAGVVGLAGLAVAQSQGGMMGNMIGSMMNGTMGGMMSTMNGATMERHYDYAQGQVPVDYQTVNLSIIAKDGALSLGKAVYEDNCAACHGNTGNGDGEAGIELNPHPVNLNAMSYNQMPAEGLLYYAISEGGEKYGSDMPAFKDVLSEEERWAAVAYVQNGLAR